MGLLMITHYQRLLDYIQPQFVHVLMNGRIVHTGDATLAKRLEAEGYDWLRKELDLADEDGTDIAGDNEGELDADLDALFM